MLYALTAQSIYVIYITESILKKGESVDALLKEIVSEHFGEVNYFGILFCKSLFFRGISYIYAFEKFYITPTAAL